MTDATALLQQLGFSEYEARAYLALLQRNPLNGYELAKVSGLPRANIYAVLQKLEERGAIVRLDTPNGTRYAPIPPTELTQRVATRFQQTLNAVQQALEDLATPVDPEYVWNIRGYTALFEHAHDPPAEVAHVDHLDHAVGRARREHVTADGHSPRPVRQAADVVVR